jgi:hypothetical protein
LRSECFLAGMEEKGSEGILNSLRAYRIGIF